MNDRPSILFVDHNARNVSLVTAFLESEGYPTTGLSEASKLDDLIVELQVRPYVSLAFIDLTGFDASIWDRCRALHEAGIAFVVIARPQSAVARVDLQRQSHGMGARHTITKPLRKDQLLALVRILTGTDD